MAKIFYFLARPPFCNSYLCYHFLHSTSHWTHWRVLTKEQSIPMCDPRQSMLNLGSLDIFLFSLLFTSPPTSLWGRGWFVVALVRPPRLLLSNTHAQWPSELLPQLRNWKKSTSTILQLGSFTEFWSYQFWWTPWLTLPVPTLQIMNGKFESEIVLGRIAVCLTSGSHTYTALTTHDQSSSHHICEPTLSVDSAGHNEYGFSFNYLLPLNSTRLTHEI